MQFGVTKLKIKSLKSPQSVLQTFRGGNKKKQKLHSLKCLSDWMRFKQIKYIQKKDFLVLIQSSTCSAASHNTLRGTLMCVRFPFRLLIQIIAVSEGKTQMRGVVHHGCFRGVSRTSDQMLLNNLGEAIRCLKLRAIPRAADDQ